MARASSSLSSPAAWGQPALDWLSAEYTAGIAGVPLLAPFVSPDVVVDHRCCLGRIVKGRDAWLAQLQQIFPDGLEEKVVGDPYLDAEGELLSVRQSVHEETWDLAVLRSYDRSGVTRMQYAVSLQIARGRTLDTAPYDTIDRLARAYVSAWSGGAAGELRRIYAPDARITDTVEGIDLRGLGAVASASHASPASGAGRMALARLPELYRTADGRTEDGGPAVFVTGTSPGDVSQVWLRVASSAGASCTSDVAVVLTLDRGLVTRERRLHGVPSVRRCQGTPPQPKGWWDSLARPPKPTDTKVTGTLPGPDGPIEIRNGTAALQKLVAWGLARFRAGGLEGPPVRSVTFQTGVRQCADVAGLASSSAGGEALVLCFDDADVCDDTACDAFTLVARATVLHELAHAWLDHRAGATARDAFVRQSGLRAWSDPADAWQDRGSERAAETLTWGLLDQEWRAVRIGDPPCDVLERGFRTLTGAWPLRGSCSR